MNVHEYQAKDLLREYGVAVPAGGVASTPAEVEEVARGLDKGLLVVKAQVHAGGRGKGGGIRLVQSPAEAKQVAAEILGMTLKTHQTGPEGKLVRKVYVESGSEIAHEYYLGIVLDRAAENLAIIASTEGGVEIEEVASKTPEKILKEPVDPMMGLSPYQARRLAKGIGLAQPSGSGADFSPWHWRYTSRGERGSPLRTPASSSEPCIRPCRVPSRCRRSTSGG